MTCPTVRALPDFLGRGPKQSTADSIRKYITIRFTKITSIKISIII